MARNEAARSQGGPEPPRLVHRDGRQQPSMPAVGEHEDHENSDLQQSDYRIHFNTPKAYQTTYNIVCA
jgi:hypothetical protein